MGSVVITTIQRPTSSVVSMLEMARRHAMNLIVVGDRKTPDVPWPEGVEYLSIGSQLGMDLRLPALLPENHYGRKNLGYLLAMSHGAEVVFDTDDDNSPLDSWRRRQVEVSAGAIAETGWVNAYRWFTDEHVWPRGLPLECIRDGRPRSTPEQTCLVRAPIQQGLANGSPDVDAVWRLTLEREIVFQDNGGVLLGKGAWCPFNSQSTWWFPEAYPLMYLPSFVSFRMTDIWRSFVAQRCLWAMGGGIVFHGPEMFQDRNAHNLLRDFEQEIPGYLGNDRIRKVLECTKLSDRQCEVGDNLRRCYEVLVSAGFVPEREMTLVEAWLSDVKSSTVKCTDAQGASE